MATIALYGSKINQMPFLIRDLRSSVSDYRSELQELGRKTLTVDRSVCNLDEVVREIQASAQTQESRVELLEAFQEKSGEFIDDTVRIDDNVASTVNSNKNDFYEKYDYLKPDCEKSDWERFCDGVKAVGEWCKENWKTIVKVVVVAVLVVGSIVLLCTGVGGILAAMAWGAILGAALGGAAGGIASAVSGGSFWEGALNGAFTGAIGGAIGGGITCGLTAVVGPATTFVGSVFRSAAIGAASGGGSNLGVSVISILLEKGTLEGSGGTILASVASGALVGGILGGLSEIGKNLKAFHQFKSQAKTVDVSTNPNEATFYSGNHGQNRRLAEEFARANGKKTIEMTAGGSYFDKLGFYKDGAYQSTRITQKQADTIWRILSDRYSSGASGNVFTFTENATSSSVFNTVELPNIVSGYDSGRITNVFYELLKGIT